MKKHMLMLAMAMLSFLKFTYSQTDSSGYYDSIPKTDPAVVMDSIYSAISPTEIVSGILMDKGITDLNPALFSGTNIEADIFGTYNRWFRLYTEVMNSRMSNSTLLMPNHDSLLHRIIYHNGNSHLTIGMLYVNYETITEDTSQNYFFFTNGKLQDNTERTSSPYNNHSFFSVAATREYHLLGNVTYLFPSNLFFSNIIEVGTAEMEVDFDDGEGFVSVVANIPFEVSYATAGEKEVTVRITHGTTVRNAKFKVNILNGANGPNAVTNLQYWDDPESSAEAAIYLANGHTHIEKAFIMSEGFDALDEYNLPELQRLMNSDRELLNNGFIDHITDLGYDFVILNLLRTGHQSIENNANVMRRLINHCIAQGSAENIVGGVSMGGIVSRMALTKMEKELCEDHKTVMYISYDSPHKGAVIPLGLQYLANEMNRVTYTAVGDLQKRKFQLNCTAAKQMLVSHASTWGNPSNDFIALQERLAVLNYPEKCRRVSVSLGNSSTNTFDPLNANNLLLGGSAYSFGAEVLNIYDNGNLYKNVHSYVDNPYWSQDVLRLHLAYRPRIWRFRLMSEDIVNSRFFHKAGLGFDYSPGGFTSTQRGVANAFNEISGNTAHTNWRDQHCIIPVNSAIDLKCNNCSTLVQNQNKAYFISNNLVPFDNIYTYDANNYNYLHDAAITPQCSTFLITEVINHMNNTNSPANSYLQSTLSTIYNFGTPYPYHNGINSVTINSGGTLKINNNTATQYGSGPTPAPSAEPFEVRTSSCSNAIVTITSGGEVVVGDASSNDHTANLIFSSQSSIVIQNGGTLTINENSRLIIKPGAKIKFETGAIINLVGANSILEIQGELNISSGATFEYTGDGFIRFSLPQATPAQAINITGSGTFDVGAASMSDKIIEVTKGYVDIAGSLTQFKLFKGTVELGTDAYLDIHSETDLQQINFKSLNSASGHVHKGVKLNNQPAADITLKHCEFRNAKTGLLRSTSSSDALYMLGCKFFDCNKGVHTINGGADFKAVRFDNCSTAAWQAENMTELSDFTGWVEDCGAGLQFEADNTDADLYVYSTLFKNTTFAIDVIGDVTTTVRCSKFEDNYSNISVTDGILNLSTSQSVTRIGSPTGSQQGNSTGYGGDNAFVNTTSEDISISSGAEDVYLDEGHNSFTYTSNPAFVITGALTNSYYSSNNFNVTDNYWSMYQTINGIYTNINYPAPASISVTYNTSSVAVTHTPTLSTLPANCSHWDGEDDLEEGGGQGKRAENSTGVKGIIKANPIFKLYPNPANDVLYLKSNTTEGTTVKLIDMLGREIYLVSSTTLGNATIFSTSHLATGVYQVIVESNGSIVHKDKLVIAR